jgi:thiamine-phosphate pyrophosphorylase
VPGRYPAIQIPCLWLMTDERLDESLWQALDALPRGAGIVFRHYATEPTARRALFHRVAKIARRRGLVLLRAGSERLGRGEAGTHGPGRSLYRLHSRSVHSRTEAIAAKRAGADLLFVSPVHATRSHPGARPLGPRRAAMIARGLGIPAIALGGMNAARFATLRNSGFYGWAAIDAWAPPANQKRKAVPI